MSSIKSQLSNKGDSKLSNLGKIGSKQSLTGNASSSGSLNKADKPAPKTKLAGLGGLGGAKKKMGGGLFSKLKNKKGGGAGKKKSNWFRIQNNNIKGGMIAEDKLKIPLTHLSEDYINFDLDENVEDDYLEDEDDNTYHKSESTMTNRSKKNHMDGDSEDEEDNFENNNLLKLQ